MAEPRANTRREANPLGTIRRVIWYALRTVLIASAILALCYGVFTEAMYISNIYIVTTEGMSMRAEAVLRSASVSDLRQFFTEEQISRDVLLYRGDYHDFTVESYDYRYEIKGFRVYPWKTVGTVTYIERIPVINATPNSESDSGAGTGAGNWATGCAVSGDCSRSRTHAAITTRKRKIHTTRPNLVLILIYCLYSDPFSP